MSWSVYSPENFPKRDEDNNEWVDYKGALGCTIILHAHTWTELEDFYKHTHYESWVQDAGNARETVVTGKQVAERLQGDFRLRGIRCANLDKITADEKSAIEKDAEATNMKFRWMFITRFEQQFRVKTQGGPGRWIPNFYEEECYRLHNRRPPDVVPTQAPVQSAAPIIVQPDMEMVQQLVAQQVESRLAEMGLSDKK